MDTSRSIRKLSALPAVAVLVVALVVVVVFVVTALGRVTTAWERFQLADRRLASLEQLDQSRDALLEAQSAWVQAPKPFRVADTRANGAAALQSDVSRMASESAVQVVSARPIDDVRPLGEDLSELVIELQFRATVSQLASFLARVDAVPQVTVARDVMIRRLPSGRSQVERPLSVRMRLHAVFLEAP